MSDIVLTVQNTEIETLGNLNKLFESDGYMIKSINVGNDVIPKEAKNYAAIVILGGYMSVNDDLPYLRREQQLIRNARENKIPVLGICLGSQLIAQALGGRVYRGKKKEIGWFDVTINDAGMNDIFYGIDSKTIKVFQWHGDTYELPESAILLASSALYPQAFRIENNIGILFHLEVNSEMIQNWADEYEIELREEGVTRQELLDKRKLEFEDLANNCKVVYSNFSKILKLGHV